MQHFMTRFRHACNFNTPFTDKILTNSVHWQVCEEALNKRYNQGWLMEKTNDLDECVRMIRQSRRMKQATSIGYHGNVVDLWYCMISVSTFTLFSRFFDKQNLGIEPRGE